ncbi:hypothetical protein LIA77_04694 [Sarocladium implicatum]|nr:hypothetical protein LIA77_04694 [Sarocladium implicatum]
MLRPDSFKALQVPYTMRAAKIQAPSEDPPQLIYTRVFIRWQCSYGSQRSPFLTLSTAVTAGKNLNCTVLSCRLGQRPRLHSKFSCRAAPAHTYGSQNPVSLGSHGSSVLGGSC